MLWTSQIALVVKNLPANAGDVETRVGSLGQEDPLEEGMAIYSSNPAYTIPWTDKAGGLESTGSQRVRHNRNDLAYMQKDITERTQEFKLWV